MFIPFVVKLYAWMYISEEYLSLLCSKGLSIKIATWMFCCHSYLPVSVLCIKDGLSKIDPDIPKAAADLGASRARVVTQILLPLSASAILTSAITTSILAFGEFVIPEILGNGVLRTIGGVASAECLVFHDLPMSATIAVFMMLWSLIPVLFCRYMAFSALRYVARL
jgi:ABC-type spermidine/putrescine transport system permease subunit I